MQTLGSPSRSQLSSNPRGDEKKFGWARERQGSPPGSGLESLAPAPRPQLWELPDMMSALEGERGNAKADLVREVAFIL